MGKSTDKKKLQKIEQHVHDRLDKLEQHLFKEDSDEEYIHRIRVHIKHLRAWLRLLRIKIDELYWKDMDRELRDLARSLGGARDMQVIVETLQEFDQRAVNDAEHRVIQKLEKTCNHEEVADKIDWSSFKRNLLDHISTFHEYYIDAHSFDQLRKDLKRCYKKARKKGDLAYADDHDFQNMHRLRKHVKALNYQVGYINNGADKRGKKIKKQLDRLGELLGKIHDLDIVRLHMENLSGRRFNKNDRLIMGNILERELQALLKDTRILYENIFSRKPGQFVEFMD